MHVIDVARDDGQLLLTVETSPRVMGCPACGVVAASHGRRARRLHDIPAFGAPVQLTWLVRRWRCAEPACEVGVFTESHDLAPARAKLTSRAAWRGGAPRRHLVQVLLEDPEQMLVQAEVVRRDGREVGYVRSASYGFTLGGAVGLAMVDGGGDPVTADWLAAGSWTVQVGNGIVPARVSLAPMYDPSNERIRG